MKRNLTILLAVAFVLGACKKDHGEAPDTQPPVINLKAPTNNQTVGVNQNFTVAATVTDNKRIEEIHLEITTGTTFITHEHFAPDGSTYALSRDFSLTAGTYQIKVEADDDSGNNAEAQVTIKVR